MIEVLFTLLASALIALGIIVVLFVLATVVEALKGGKK